MGWGGDIPALSAMNVKDGYIEFNDETHYGSEELYSVWMSQGDCKKDDIVLTMEAPMGNVALIPDNNKYILSQRVILIKFNENKVNSQYMYQYLKSPYFQNQMNKYSTGTTAKGIKQKNLIKIKLKIPTLEEQKSVSNFLKVIDQKIELMETKLKNNDEIINNIRNKIYTNISNPIKCELKDICNIIKGKQLNKEYMNNTAKYYVLNGGKFPSGYTDNWNVKENTITISEGGESCGYVNYNKEKFYCGGHCYYLELKDEINKYYFFNYLKFREQDIMRLRVGSGLPNIQKKDLLKLKIEIHDSNQEKIGTLLQLLVNKSLNLKKEIKYYQEFKKSLLNKMFC